MAKTYGRLSELNSGIVKLRENCRAIEPEFGKVVDGLMTLAADEGEGRMTARAPWSDNTGNRDDRQPGAARAALFTATDLQGPHKSILFSHGVDYGIWLEISNHGKYQIIMPTVAFMGRKLMKSLRGTLSALRES